MDPTDWDARYRERELVWSAGPNVFVEEELADLPPGRALDLAAGEGRNALWLAARGWQVEAVEFSAVAIDKGRQLAAARGLEVAWTLADLTEEPRLAPADLVLLAYLQLAPAPLAQVLRTAAALVAPGGTLLLVAHARRNLVDGVGGPQDPDVLPTVAQVVAGLRQDRALPALQVVRAEEVRRPVETEDGRREAIDLLVRAHR